MVAHNNADKIRRFRVIFYRLGFPQVAPWCLTPIQAIMSVPFDADDRNGFKMEAMLYDGTTFMASEHENRKQAENHWLLKGGAKAA